MTPQEKADLASRFAETIVEGLDMDTLVSYAVEQMTNFYLGVSEEQLVSEVKEYCPNLLED